MADAYFANKSPKESSAKPATDCSVLHAQIAEAMKEIDITLADPKTSDALRARLEMNRRCLVGVSEIFKTDYWKTPRGFEEYKKLKAEWDARNQGYEDYFTLRITFL